MEANSNLIVLGYPASLPMIRELIGKGQSEWSLVRKKWSLSTGPDFNTRNVSLFISPFVKATFYLITATFKLVYTTGMWWFPLSYCSGKNSLSNLCTFFPSYVVGKKQLFLP